MNKQKFVEFIRKPDSLTTKNLEEIQEVVSTYPYFQNARIILAKGAKIKDLPDSKEKIASASIYASNRALLKKYINDELIFLRPLDAHESVQTDSKPTPKITKSHHDEIKSDSSIVTAEAPVVLEQPEEPEVIIPAEPVVEKPESKVEILKESEEPETQSTLTDETEQPSDLDGLISELWKDIDELRKSKARFLEIEKRIEEEDAVEKAVKKATQSSSSKSVEKPAKKATAKKNVAAKTPVKKSTAQAKPAATSRAKKSSKKSSDTTEKKDKDSSDSDKPGGPSGDSTFKKINQNEIIEKFIQTNPSMPKPNRSDSVKMEDLSQDSIEMNPEIASEYLAEIYLEQGRKDRAIQIYEKLIVKFPEKSVYFAGVIKKLNKGS